MRLLNKKHVLYFLLFVCATVLPLFLWSGLQGADNLYMYAHAEDMLEHGLVRDTDVFSMHENLSFMYQKWAACIVTYFIVHNFGWHGLTIATYILVFAFLLSLFLFGHKLNRRYMIFNTVVVMVCAFEMEANGTLRFRPHVFAGIVFIYMFYVLEQYALNVIRADWKFYLKFAVSGIVLMWFHSTMWIMFVVAFLPYIFDFSGISDIFYKQDYRIMPLIKSLSVTFVSGILNPNGIKQYGYIFACTQASGNAYSHVDELQPMPFVVYAQILLVWAVIFVFMLHGLFKCHVAIYLPSLYLVAGSLIMPLISWRLVFYSMLFMSVAAMMQASRHSDRDLGFDRMIMPFSLSMMVLVIVCTGLIVRMRYAGVPDSALECGTREYEINDAIDMLADRSPGSTVFNMNAHVGSYCIYRNLKPYMDCRAEVYDININKNRDILSEIHDFNDGIYDGMELVSGGLMAADQTYYPDYYVVTKYSNGDMYLKDALDASDAACLYAGDSVWIYSFKDFENF